MLTSLESRCLELLDDINIWLTQKVKPKKFREIVGKIRDLRYALLNKHFGCSTGRHRGRCSCKGFTLIELMIVVALIGILAAVALPQFNKLIRRAQEARTLANLHVLRTCIAEYNAGHEGHYPLTLDALIQDGILTAIPVKYTPPYHPAGNTVSMGPMSAQNGSTGDWFYVNDPNDGSYGSVFVNCVHTTLRGQTWTSL